VLTQKLHRLGARVVMVENWASLSHPTLSMASKQADIVFAHMVLHHMHLPALTIAEIKRVLRPGGRLVITEKGKYDDPLLKAQRRDRWMGFYTSDIRHWLKKVGFSNIIVNPVPYRLLGIDAKNPDFTMDTGLIMATAIA
jgi:SAM-dependent methyltransferase